MKDSALRVTILGASPVQPNPGGACAGYLVDHADTRLLIDCGPGVLSRVLTLTPLAELDAVIISHAHPDHFFDLIGLRYGMIYGPHPPAAAPDIYVAPGMRRVLEDIGRALEPGHDFWSGLPIVEYEPAGALNLKGCVVRFAPTRHYVDCWAMRIEAGGHSLAYTADTGPSDDVLHLAAGVDVLLSECTLPSRVGHEDEWGHLAPAEAAAMAGRAEAGRLLLTHTWSEYRGGLVAATRGAFDGPVALAQELETYVVD